MSLQVRLADLIAAIGADMKSKAALVHSHVATTDLTATGTKNNTTFLRGDNTWAAPTVAGMAAIASSGSASDLVAGTVPDAQLPGRIAAQAQVSGIATDLNNATVSGWYYSSNSAANSPTAGHYITQVISSNTDNLVQLAFEYGFAAAADTRSYMRVKAGAAWGSWFRTRLSEAETDDRSARSTLGAAEKSAAMSASTGSISGNAATASGFTLSPSGNVTAMAFTGVPASGTMCTLTLVITQSSTVRTIAWPTGTVHMSQSGAPTQVASKVCISTLLTLNGGTTWYVWSTVQP